MIASGTRCGSRLEAGSPRIVAPCSSGTTDRPSGPLARVANVSDAIYNEHDSTKPAASCLPPAATMSGSVLTALPVYNEAVHLSEVLDEVLRFSPEILVVDDGSADETPGLLRSRNDIRVLTHDVNRGYGAALASAFEYSIEQGFDVLITIDCDGQHEPSRIPQLVDVIRAEDRGAVDIVSGSRYLQQFPNDNPPPPDRRAINAEVTRLINEQLNLNLTDAFCGFKGYRTEALGRLNISEAGYAMPLQLWVQAAALGLRIVEFPIPLIYLDEDRSFGGALDDADHRMAYYLDVLDRELAAHTFA